MAVHSRRLSSMPVRLRLLLPGLFPEFMHMELAVDTKPEGFLPPGYVDKGGEVYHVPIKGHEHVGLGGTEVKVYRKVLLVAQHWQIPQKPNPVWKL